MGRAVEFTGWNKTYGAPHGQKDRVSDARTFVNGNCVVLCWQLDPDELREVLVTGRVFVTMLSGTTLFPHFIGSAKNVRDVVSGYGKTIPQQEPVPVTKLALAAAALGAWLSAGLDDPNSGEAFKADVNAWFAEWPVPVEKPHDQPST